MSALRGEIEALERRLAELKAKEAEQSGGAPYCSEVLLPGLPVALLTDSYKAGHFAQYPDALKMVAYGAFRKPFKLKDGTPPDKSDTRLVFYGIRYIVESYFNVRWTTAAVDAAAHFYSTHNVMNTPYPFPKEMFHRFIRENDGYLPVKLEALPEGSVVHAGCPVFQVTAEAPYAHLCTFMETLLTHVWYPSTVATLSRRARDVIEASFERTVDGGAGSPLLASRLHDFGFRGCTSVEQSVLGGCAHLLNFEGTDTMSAAFYAQYALNEGRPVAASIPATEHSVMTSWPTEREAMLNMIERFGSGVWACVMDSYDYAHALAAVLPSVAAQKTAAGGFLVLRPDSGDPVDVVLSGLHAAEAVFGSDTNSKGFRVPRGCSVIQGDGIDLATLTAILAAVEAAGFSAQAVGFGMGGGLLQKVNRDTMSFATKLCHIHYASGVRHDVMKAPKTDPGKFSLPGILQVRREGGAGGAADALAGIGGVPTAYSVPEDGAGAPLVSEAENLLRVVYDKRPLMGAPPGAAARGLRAWESFDDVRARVARQWAATPKTADNVSAQLKARVAEVSAAIHARVSEPMP